MKADSERNINSNYNNNLDNYYKELLNWINSIKVPLCKEVKNIDDLKDGNVFLELLKYYFQQNRQKYYYSLLNSKIKNKNIYKKIQLIFQIITQITNNDEINSRIEIFQKDINNFLENNNLIMELVLFINYLFKKNIYDGNKIYDIKENTNILNTDPTINLYKKKKFNFNEKDSKEKDILKDFYDHNKYKRKIVNNLKSKNYNYNNYKSNENIKSKKTNNKLSYNMDNKFNKKNKKDNITINNYNNKPKNLSKTSFHLFYNNENNKNNYELNKQKSININYNNYDLNSIINNSNNNRKNSFDINKRKRIKKNLFFNEFSNKEKELFNNIERINTDNPSSKILENNYISNNNNNNNNKFTQNNIENNIKKNFNLENINKRNIKCIFGIFHNDKLDLLENDEEKLNIYKLFKLTNPFSVINNEYKKLNPKINYEKKEIKLIKVNKVLGKNNNIDNNSTNSSINYNKKNLNKNNLDSFYHQNDSNNSSKNNKKYKSFSSLKNKKIYREDNENDIKFSSINYLMDKFEPKPKKILVKQNPYLSEMNKKVINNLIEPNEDNIKHKEGFSYSNYLKNNSKNSNKKNYNKKNENISKIYNKKISNSVDTYRYTKNDKKKEIINKNDILNWLIDIDILKKEDANNIAVPENVSDGIILCDIINIFENNKIEGIFRKINSKEDAFMNINKALDYLKTLEKFPKRHVLSNELIFEIDEQTIWELLYDLYIYYSNKMSYRKKKDENNNNNNQNKKDNNLLNIYKKSISRNKKKNLSEKKQIIYNLNEIKENINNEIKNNDKKNYNYKKYDIKTDDSYNSFNSNSLYKSDGFYHNNIYKNILFNYNYTENNNNIKYKSNLYLEKMEMNKNLTDRFVEDNKFIRKRYFDYINELKYHFDQKKFQNKIAQENEDYFQYLKSIQQPLNYNYKYNLDYNFNNINIYNNTDNKMIFGESPIRQKSNYMEYYNKCYSSDNRYNKYIKDFYFEN